jgi:hypothetical protein
VDVCLQGQQDQLWTRCDIQRCTQGQQDSQADGN